MPNTIPWKPFIYLAVFLAISDGIEAWNKEMLEYVTPEDTAYWCKSSRWFLWELALSSLSHVLRCWVSIAFTVWEAIKSVIFFRWIFPSWWWSHVARGFSFLGAIREVFASFYEFGFSPQGWNSAFMPILTNDTAALLANCSCWGRVPDVATLENVSYFWYPLQLARGALMSYFAGAVLMFQHPLSAQLLSARVTIPVLLSGFLPKRFFGSFFAQLLTLAFPLLYYWCHGLRGISMLSIVISVQLFFAFRKAWKERGGGEAEQDESAPPPTRLQRTVSTLGQMTNPNDAMIGAIMQRFSSLNLTSAQEESLQHEIRRRNGSASEEGEVNREYRSSEPCVICLDSPPQLRMIPCQHVAVCCECFKVLEEAAAAENQFPKCPVCRIEVLNTVLAVRSQTTHDIV